MIKKTKNRTKLSSEINVVPYIDVMLVLLVIFMITAPILTQGVTVDLPKVASTAIEVADHEPIIVSVNRDGELFLNLNANPDSPMSPQDLMLRVAAEMELAKQTGETLHVLVKGDQGVGYGKVVTAMSLLKQAGASQVGLLTDTPDLQEEQV